MRTIRRVKIEYQCQVCKTKYPTKKEALACESRALEEKKFVVGDLVEAKEERECLKHNESYSVRGIVTKIIDPQAPDEEYEIKWLRIPERRRQHVFQYEVTYHCPHCGEKCAPPYYAPEIEKVDKH